MDAKIRTILETCKFFGDYLMINPVTVFQRGAFKRVVRCLWKGSLVPVKVKTPSVFAKILTVFIKISTVFDKIPTVLYVFLRGDNDVACPSLFLRNVLEGLLQQRPEGLDGGDEGALSGGVGRLHRGAEADDIEMGILAEDN